METDYLKLKAEINKLKLKLHEYEKALIDIRDWNEDLEYEWGDTGIRAAEVLINNK